MIQQFPSGDIYMWDKEVEELTCYFSFSLMICEELRNGGAPCVIRDKEVEE